MKEFILILILGSPGSQTIDIYQKPFSSLQACVDVGKQWSLYDSSGRNFNCLSVKKSSGAYK